MELKQDLFKELGQHAPKHAVLATNTSTMSISKIAEASNRPEQVIGMHFFTPIPLLRLIELIKGESKATHTIKQIGGYDPESKIRLFIHGVPTFQVGNSYVVFLPEKSNLGFSSPLGLYQGSYAVTTINGEQVVSNGRNLTEPASTNSHAIQVPLAINADRPSRSRLPDFINTIRSYNTH